MIRHFTSSAIVFNQAGQVLLVHHNKIEKWLYPGGHVDADEDPAEAALREIAEETGIKAEVATLEPFTHQAVRSIPTPFAIIEMDIEDRKVGPHRHIDFVYVCRTDDDTISVQFEEVAQAAWFDVVDVAELATPEELPSLIARAAHHWRELQQS